MMDGSNVPDTEILVCLMFWWLFYLYSDWVSPETHVEKLLWSTAQVYSALLNGPTADSSFGAQRVTETFVFVHQSLSQVDMSFLPVQTLGCCKIPLQMHYNEFLIYNLLSYLWVLTCWSNEGPRWTCFWPHVFPHNHSFYFLIYWLHLLPTRKWIPSSVPACSNKSDKPICCLNPNTE